MHRFVLLVATALATFSVAAPAADASSGVLFVASNTTLTEDHVGTVVVAANNVTLDCAGHQISPPASGADYGIVIVNRTGVTVANCTTTGFRRDGLILSGSSDNLVVGSTALDNGANGDFEAAGFFVDSEPGADANGNVFRRDVAIGNAGGGFLLNGHGNLITGTVFAKNVANNNLWFGFGAWRASANTWTNNVANNSGHWGFAFFEDCAGNEITGNVARSSAVSDAYDLTGLNTWTGNNFGTTNP
jgi:parallel beta-helix repeat protein